MLSRGLRRRVREAGEPPRRRHWPEASAGRPPDAGVRESVSLVAPTAADTPALTAPEMASAAVIGAWLALRDEPHEIEDRDEDVDAIEAEPLEHDDLDPDDLDEPDADPDDVELCDL
jgi:hypothetical protein